MFDTIDQNSANIYVRTLKETPKTHLIISDWHYLKFRRIRNNILTSGIKMFEPYLGKLCNSINSFW